MDRYNAKPIRSMGTPRRVRQTGHRRSMRFKNHIPANVGYWDRRGHQALLDLAEAYGRRMAKEARGAAVPPGPTT